MYSLSQQCAIAGGAEAPMQELRPFGNTSSSVRTQWVSFASISGTLVHFDLTDKIKAFVSTSRGLIRIPSYKIPLELANSPDPVQLLDKSRIKLRTDSISGEIKGFYLKHSLLGGSKEDSAVDIVKQIEEYMKEGLYGNVINRAQLLNEIPMDQITKHPSIVHILLKALYESFNPSKNYPRNSVLGDSVRLILSKMAIQFCLSSFSRNLPMLKETKDLLNIQLERTENRLYIEIKFLKYLHRIQNDITEILGKTGTEALEFVGSLQISKVIEQIQQPKQCKGTPFYRSFSGQMMGSLLGRYLILACLRQKKPKRFHLKRITKLLEYGWKTTYRILEVLTTWCLKRNIRDRKRKEIITNILIPIVKHNNLGPRYNWRIREKAVECLIIINPLEDMQMALKELECNEKDSRVLRTIKKQDYLRFDLGHRLWRIKTKQTKNLRLPEHFVGRKKEIENLVSILSQKGRITSVLGCAGIGKTTLVIKSIHTMKELGLLESIPYDGILLIDCNRNDHPSCFLFDLQFDCTEIYCSSRNLDYLRHESFIAIIDSSDCLGKSELATLIEKLKGMSLIITSRRLSDKVSKNVINLRSLDVTESQELFRLYYGIIGGSPMCGSLGGLPLAVEDFSKSIRKINENSEKSIYFHYKDEKKWLERYLSMKTIEIEKEALDRDFSAIFLIRDSIAILPKESVNLLGILGCMGFDYFEEEYLAREFRGGLDGLKEYHFVEDFDGKLRIAHSLIYNYAFFNIEPDNLYIQLQHFLGLFLRIQDPSSLLIHVLRIQERALIEQCYREVVRFAISYDYGQCLNVSDEGRMWMMKRGLKASKRMKKYHYISEIQHSISYLYTNRGWLSEAIKWLKKSLKANKYADNRMIEASILNEMGINNVNLGLYHKGLKLIKKCGGILRKVPNRSESLIYYYYLGIAYSKLGNFSKYEKYVKKATWLSDNTEFRRFHITISNELSHIYIKKRKFSVAYELIMKNFSMLSLKGRKNDLIEMYHTLGIFYFYKNNYSESIRCFKEELSMVVKQRKEKRSLLDCYTSLGIAYMNLGENLEAKVNLERAESLLNTIEYNYFQGFVYKDLGIVHLCIGEYKKGKEYLKKAKLYSLEYNNKILECLCLRDLGVFYLMTGNAQKAMEMLKKSKSINTLFKNNIFINTLSSIGAVHYELGNIERAVKCLNKSILANEKYEIFYDKAYDLTNLGSIHFKFKKYEEAKNLFQEALQISKELGFKGVEIVCLEFLGNIKAIYGEKTDAIKLLEDGHSIARNTEHLIDIASLLANKATVCYDTGDIDKAISLSERALNLFRKQGIKKEEAVILGNLANMHRIEGRTTKAIEYTIEAIELARELKDRWQEAGHHNTLGTLYFDLEDNEKALFHYRLAFHIKQKDFKFSDPTILENIGQIYLDGNKVELAFKSFMMALNIHTESGSKDGECTAYYHLAQYYSIIDNLEMARNYYEKSLAIAQDIQNIQVIENATEELADLNEFMSNE